MSSAAADDRFDESATPTSARMPPFDAVAAAVIGHASGPAIPASSLSAARLKRVFAARARGNPK